MITEHDGRRLRRSGFTHREIDEFANAYNWQTGADQPPVKLDSPVWKKVMRRRRRLVNDILDTYEEDTGMRMSRRRLDRIIDSYGINPWAWIKLEYRHSRERVRDFTEAMGDARREALVETRRLRKAVLRWR